MSRLINDFLRYYDQVAYERLRDGKGCVAAEWIFGEWCESRKIGVVKAERVWGCMMDQGMV